MTRQRPTGDETSARIAELEQQLAACSAAQDEIRRERDESLEQQTATGRILETISSSPTNLQMVLDEIVQVAVRLCAVDSAGLLLIEGDRLRAAATTVPGGLDMAPLLPRTRGSINGRALIDRRTVHVADLPALLDTEYPDARESQATTGYRAAAATPLLREGEPLGTLSVSRDEARPFAAEQIALLETLAHHAVIAIENTRLFTELQSRNRDLGESLEQQTATSEVLEIISRTPTDLQTVLDAIVERAARLTDTEGAAVSLVRGADIDAVAAAWQGRHSSSISLATPFTYAGMVGPESTWGVAVLERRTIAVHGGPEAILARYPRDEATYVFARNHGMVPHGSALVVPLRRGGETFGLLTALRAAAEPYTPRQIALLETFAGQAVVAMENARLFEELEQRNRDLVESLEQQTATAEVLRIIGGSPENQDAALQAVADTVARLCRAESAGVWLQEGDDFVLVHSASSADIVYPVGIRFGSVSQSRGLVAVDAARTGRTVHADDLIRYAEEHGASAEHLAMIREPLRRHGIRASTTLNVPLMRGGSALGVLTLGRPGDQPRPFSPREIALAETFADQAVIAIENARLFDQLQTRQRELAESVEQLQSLSTVTRTISSTLDLDDVLRTIVRHAQQLCETDNVAIFEFDAAAGEFHLQVLGGVEVEIRNQLEATPLRLGEGAVGRAGQTRAPVQVADIQEDDSYTSSVRPALLASGNRAVLAVPLLREDELLGAIAVTRHQPGRFPQEVVQVLRTFADQAAIAIQNTRLFDELQARTRELEAASRAKSEFLSRMSHELRTPLNAVIGFAEIMEMDPATSARQHERVRHIHQGGRHLLNLINEVLDITRIESGRLSLSPEPVRLDGVVQEVLDLERPLAAEARVALHLEDPAAFRVTVQADRQRLRQVILNLVTNAVKYNYPGGRVTLGVSDEERGVRSEERGEAGAERRVRLTVRDTGPGIPADQLDRLFEPFERLSADQSGVEGTGLGLAIARGLVEAMGGAIGVESAEGEGSAFWIELPPAASMPALPEPEELVRAGADDDAPQTATVLYIEDNLPNVDLVQHILSFRPGITLLTAPDGVTGVRIATRYRPDLVLLDLNLPDLQGDEVLARLRAGERTAAIPVIMVSADATQGQIDRLLAAGATAYLTKPLDVKRFLALIDETATATGQG
ncbi:MAG: GAF domain-containing protein [Chloroflexi bacterium]|nr:GAF domain-containing protein [Chloroflexota bacterium]